VPTPAPTPTPAPVIDGYSIYEHQNAYSGHGATEIDTDPVMTSTEDACTKRCEDDSFCECVTFCAGNSGACAGRQGSCWKRSNCYPASFEQDSATEPFTVYVRKNKPSPPGAGAVAYLKHDSMGPNGDAVVMVFNPGNAANITIDLSMLPPALFGQSIRPYDLLTYQGEEQTDVPPFAKTWTVAMGAKEMKFFSGFSLGVFAPRQGKKTGCVADDSYSKTSSSTTLQACFFECQADNQCENVFVEYVELDWMEKPPSVTCTLLGVLTDPSTGCSSGTGTLIRKLPGSRSCSQLWDDVGTTLPPAPGAPTMLAGPASPACGGSFTV